MNWNNNDTKYILKRFIIYILIAFAMFIFGTWKANALVSTEGFSRGIILQPNQTSGSASYDNLFNNVGEGFIIFTITYNSRGVQADYYLKSISQIYLSSSNDVYNCEIGNLQVYTDSRTQEIVQSVKCPVNLVNKGITGLTIGVKQNSTSERTEYWTSQYATFYSTNESSDAVIQAIQSQQQQAHQDSQNINNSINNDNITSGDADDFKNNEAFTDSTGLESVINLPLNMVNSLSNQCQPIQIHIPYLETDATIPCMSTIYSSKFNALYTLVKLVVNGFLVYRILLKVYELVHEAKQPDQDKLEVIEL